MNSHSRLIITVLLLLTTAYAYSQSEFRHGIRGGLNLVHYKGPDWSSTLSFHGGLFGQYRFGKSVSMVSDLFISNDLSSRNYQLIYLRLPVMLQVDLARRFSILFGGQLDELLDARFHYYGFVKNATEAVIYSDGRLSYAIVGGLSYQVNDRINVMFRYSKGLKEVNPDGAYLSLGYWYDRYEDGPFFQKNPDERIRFFQWGFRLGYSRYTISGNLIDKLSSPGTRELIARPGIETGLDVRFDFYKFLYGSSGIIYSQQGGELKAPPDNSGSVKIDYLQVPILLGVYILKTKPLIASLEAGPAINWAISTHNSYSEPGNTRDVFNRTMSWVQGIELSTNAFEGFNIFVSYRNIVGETKFYSRTDTFPEQELFSSGNSITVGIRRLKNNVSDK